MALLSLTLPLWSRVVSPLSLTASLSLYLSTYAVIVGQFLGITSLAICQDGNNIPKDGVSLYHRQNQPTVDAWLKHWGDCWKWVLLCVCKIEREREVDCMLGRETKG